MSRRPAARRATAWARLCSVVPLAWLLVAFAPLAVAQTIDHLSPIKTDIDRFPLVCDGGAILYFKDDQPALYDLTNGEKQAVKATKRTYACQRKPDYLISSGDGIAITDYSGRVLLQDEDLISLFRIEGRRSLFANTVGTIRSKTPKGIVYTKIRAGVVGGIVLPDQTALLILAPGRVTDLLMTARLGETPTQLQKVDTSNLRMTAVRGVIYDIHDREFPLKILGRTNHFKLGQGEYGIQNCQILKQILSCRAEPTVLRGETAPYYDKAAGQLFQYVSRDSCLAVLRLDDPDAAQKCVLESQFPVGVLALTHGDKTGWKIYLASESRTEGSFFRTDMSILVGQWHPAGP